MHGSPPELERLAREPYDLVILDQTMPVITGMSLAREIAGARPGVRALLQKPVEPAALSSS